jgi:hypothetical protein
MFVFVTDRKWQEEFEDTKGVIRICKAEKNRQHNGQKTEEQTTQWSKDRRTDNTMVKRQKNRQHNGQKEKDKRQKQSTKLKIE